MWPFNRRNPASPAPVQPDHLAETERRLRSRNAEMRRELSVRRLERQNRRLEEMLGTGSDFGFAQRWGDWLTRFQWGDWGTPFSGSGLDHRNGGNWPYFSSDEELSFLRSLGRLLVTRNLYAKCLLEAVTSYAIGTGMTIRVTERYKGADQGAVARVQAVVDEFIKRTRFGMRQQELFMRSRRDGEAFLRVFANDRGYCDVRFVWPEQVRTPAGRTGADSYFGVETEPGDMERVLGFWLSIEGAGSPIEPEYVSSAEMVHVKLNVDSGVKRGMPDFAFSMREISDAALKLCRNMGLGAAIREAFAYGRQHKGGVPMEAVDAFVSDQADYEVPRPYSPNSTRDVTVVEPGEIFDVPETMEFVSPPASEGAVGDVEIHQTLMHALAAYWNAPAWVASSNPNDMGAYTASLVAESPFVHRIERERERYVVAIESVFRRVLDVAESAGRLMPNDLDMAELQIEGKSIVQTDRAAETNRRATLYDKGVLSLQTWAQQEDLDFENEQTNRDALMKKAGPEAGAADVKVKTANDAIDKPNAADGNGQVGRDELVRMLGQTREAILGGMADRPAPVITVNAPPVNVTVEPPIIPAQAAPVVVVENEQPPAQPPITIIEAPKAVGSAGVTVHKVHRDASGNIAVMECENHTGTFEQVFDRDAEGRVVRAYVRRPNG
jgi:hypothetical protein